VEGFLEADPHRVLGVLPGLGAAPAPAPAAETAEQVLEGTAHAGAELIIGKARGGLRRRPAGVAVGVVVLSLFRIRKHLVGLGELLELGLRGLVPGVQVRVVLAGELPVGLLDVILGSPLGDA
jgi:hypothetical protein